MKDLRHISIIGLGLLGGSISLAISRALSRVRVVGFSHRKSTRKKAVKLAIADEVVERIDECVAKAELVILATPICTFEKMFEEIAVSLPSGCIVTDVGSTKVLSHRWASKYLPKNVYYVGSHPIAGSEQRGVDFARDDLLDRAACILTSTKTTNPGAIRLLNKFWTQLGCSVTKMSPVEHDRIFAMVSHLPHITAAALINANDNDALKFAGKGFMDTSRIASGPPNIWADIFFTNTGNCVKGIDNIIAELDKLRKAIRSNDKGRIEELLAKAKDKRARMIEFKMRKKELT